VTAARHRQIAQQRPGFAGRRQRRPHAVANDFKAAKDPDFEHGDLP
jgi:hypothetical protein